MEPLTISWIGQCATSPIVLLLSVWAIGVFHSYRRHWMSVDLFLLAMVTQELVMSLQILIFSLLNLLKPEIDAACGVFVWSMNATRALQLGTMASLLADRALTCHWPYRYRFSIRRHQLRYHLGVLAAMAALLGIAALLVRPQQETVGFPDCLTMPYDLHVRLALFLLAVYGALVLITVLSSVVVQTSRGCSGDTVEVATSSLNLASNSATVKSSDSSSSTDRPLPPSFSSTGGSRGRSLKTSASTASSASSSTVGMRAASSTADLLPSNSTGVSGSRGVLRNTSTTTSGSSGSTIPGGCDFRWSTCASVAFVSCVLNHIPYLVFVSLGTFTPRLLPPFSPDNICLWLSLLQGALLPPLLLVVDASFRRGAREASCWWKSTGTVGEMSGSGGSTLIQNSAAPFTLFPREETKSFPLTNGSLFSSLLSLPGESNGGSNSYYRKDSAPHTFRMGLHHHPSTSSGGFRGPIGPKSLGGNPNSGGGYNSSPFFYHHTTATSGEAVSADPLYSDPTNKDSSSSGSSKEDHIYATLSETFSSMSSFSDGGYLDDPSDSQHTRCASVTTIANDDFEFHDPRSSGQFSSIQEKPSHQKPIMGQYHKNMALDQYNKAVGSDQYKMRTSYQQYHGLNHNKMAAPERRISIGPTSISSNVSAASVDLASFGYKNDKATYVINSACNQNVHYRYPTENQSVEAYSNNLPLETTKQDYNMKCYNDHSNTLSGNTKATLSLSMNDLDSLGNIKNAEVSTDEQMMFVLPVKSESMLSLYRLYLAEEETDRSRMFMTRPVKSSRSESDLSCLTEDANSIPSLNSEGGHLSQIPHEIYQKHRKQSHSNSKIRKQSKIQRARGVQSKTKPIVPSKTHQKNTHDSHISKLNRLLESTDSSNSVQVSIMDNKHGRQNGVISITDPSEVSVQELFTVFNRASPQEATSKVTLNRVADLEISSVASQSPNPDVYSSKKSDVEFKKIFVSEFL